jgi:hypothetical protein
VGFGFGGKVLSSQPTAVNSTFFVAGFDEIAHVETF